MKLVEIKNSLAKLYYQPSDFPLVLSDFLTIDDGNKKILSQVVSIESTNKESTNCAILKFSLDFNDDNTYGAYSGYVPPLDALVSKTKPQILQKIFSDSKSGIELGELTNTSNVKINIKNSLFENFLYIQSDNEENTEKLTEKLLNFNSSVNKKTLYVDFDGLKNSQQGKIIELGKDFKLPIDNETLNYIYEHDLTGLTVEQKTIVQDIILEIQDYINTLESGFIPFKTLLEVVNDIYESDKSVGIILLRNKLLKYNQFNIFASSEEEIFSLQKAMEENTLTILSVKNADNNWKKEALNYVVENIKSSYYLVFEVKEDTIQKEILNKIYKAENIKPAIFSKYDSDCSAQLKSFAKNLILFKPETQQRAFATYNSFLGKLSAKEFIISGEATFYTPLILKDLPEQIEQIQTPTTIAVEPIVAPKIQAESQPPVQAELEIEEEEIEIDQINESQQLPDISEFDEISELEELQPIDEDIDSNELKNIFEESLEQEIAKDVDKIFYAEAALPLEEDFELEGNDEDEFEIEELSEINEESEENIIEEEILENADEINYDDMFSDDDLDLLDELNTEETTTTNAFENIEVSEEEIIIEQEAVQGIPIYKTGFEEKHQDDNTVKIAEGNIVYHEKYGRGVVEQLITYGAKTLCSIQFDNVGRRLLDPNLADLKQM